jgi:hypothetical protein
VNIDGRSGEIDLRSSPPSRQPNEAVLGGKTVNAEEKASCFTAMKRLEKRCSKYLGVSFAESYVIIICVKWKFFVLLVSTMPE